MYDDSTTDRLLTVAEAATMTGYSERTVRSAYQAGKLRALQTAGLGGRVRIPLSAVNEWTGHNPDKTAEPALEDPSWDWATPAEWADPNQDLVICDPATLYIRVHASKLSAFADAKLRASR